MRYGEFDDEEIAKLLEMRGMAQSAREVRANSQEVKPVDVNDIIDKSPISEYESLSDKMKAKIKKVLESLGEESSEREEKETLDEKEGKEELDPEKKKELDKIKREKGEIEDDKKDKESEEVEEKDADKEESKEEETPKKDEYLAKLKKLHKMKIVDYKYQMKTDEVDVDRYYISMMVIQKNLNRQRASYIKEYGAEELVALENQYLQEENKYKRTLINNMEVALAKLRALDEKLDAILDEMSKLQQQLEDESISIDTYNDRINVLEKDKLDTLWQINRLNPELLEEKQENLKFREKLEKRMTTASIEKQKTKDMSSLNKARTTGIKYDEKAQDGVVQKANDKRELEIKEAIDEKAQRLDEIRNELKELDMNKPEDRKKAGLLIEEYHTLTESKLALEKQQEALDKNMKSAIEDYGDLKNSEEKREASTSEFSENVKEIDFSEQTPDFMKQYIDDVIPEPTNPSEARELLDNMNKITEEAREEQEKIEPEEDKEKTLFRKKYGSNN